MPLLSAKFLSVLLITAGRLSIGVTVDSDATAKALGADAECSSGAEDCALSALQVRGEVLGNEAEQTVAEVAGLEEMGTEEFHDWPKCSKYGCFARYSRHSICQCNPHCHHYRNCCPDYDAQCTQHVPSPPAPSPPPAAQSAPPAAQSAASGGSAMCSAVPSCAKLKLGGACCPTPAGNYLGCCPESMVPHATAPPPVVVNNRNSMTLYHQTSPEACQAILKTGFRLGHGGWCGDAIYFALSPEATKTKAITPHSGIGCMLEAHVDVGNIQKFPCCRYCGGSQNEHVSWTESSLRAKGFDAIEINPGDGPEIIVYNNNRIMNMRVIPFKPEWTPERMHYKE